MSEKDLSLQTDVALIKKDLKQIERFFGKFDVALNSMSELSKAVAVQGEILKNTTEKMNNIEEKISEIKVEDLERSRLLSERLEQHRKSAYDDHQRLAAATTQNRKERNEEIMAQLAKMNGALEARLVSLDNRIKLLEQWKWYIMGLGGVLIFIAANIQWENLF